MNAVELIGKIRDKLIEKGFHLISKEERFLNGKLVYAKYQLSRSEKAEEGEIELEAYSSDDILCISDKRFVVFPKNFDKPIFVYRGTEYYIIDDEFLDTLIEHVIWGTGISSMWC